MDSDTTQGNGETAQKTTQKNDEIAQKLPRNCPEIAQKTYLAILANPHFSIAELGNETGFSERTIKYHQKILKEAGLIERVGSDRNGYWKILETTE